MTGRIRREKLRKAIEDMCPFDTECPEGDYGGHTICVNGQYEQCQHYQHKIRDRWCWWYSSEEI